jgi:hypothetical protein
LISYRLLYYLDEETSRRIRKKTDKQSVFYSAYSQYKSSLIVPVITKRGFIFGAE